MPLACAESGGLAVETAAVPRVGCAGVGASAAGARGPSDWPQEAAAKPSAAQMTGKTILIMGAL